MKKPSLARRANTLEMFMSSAPSKPQLPIWMNPTVDEEEEPNLVYLKSDAVCLAKIPAADLLTAASNVQNGGDIVAQNIPLATITQLEGDENEVELTITYRQAGGNTDSSVSVNLADSGK